MSLIMRYQYESYMGCLSEGSGGTVTETFNLIGEGFTSFPESKNPQEYSRKYVSDKTERTDVIGYAPSIEYSADCVSDDPVVMEIMKIHDGELVGNDTHRNIISVNRWEEDSSHSCPATKRPYAIVPNAKGDGTDALIYTGTMRAAGDLIKGTFNTTTKTFTADDDEAGGGNGGAGGAGGAGEGDD